MRNTCLYGSISATAPYSWIDNMEEALLPDERTHLLVSTNRLEHGWAYQKLQIRVSQQPILSAIRLRYECYFMMRLILFAQLFEFLLE